MANILSCVPYVSYDCSAIHLLEGSVGFTNSVDDLSLSVFLLFFLWVHMSYSEQQRPYSFHYYYSSITSPFYELEKASTILLKMY